MGTYQDRGEERKPMWIVYTTEGIEEFSKSILRAAEMEGISPILTRELVAVKHYPSTFYLINLSIDQVLKSLGETMPHLLPPIRESKPREKKIAKK